MTTAPGTPRRTRRSLLRRHETLTLDDAHGTVITVEHGCLWITLEHDPRDVVLSRGMRFEIDRPGRTIVTAEADSTLRLEVPLSARARIAARLTRALAHRLNDWAARLARRAVRYG